MLKIDLNCDMGESFGHYGIGMDDEVIKLITSANIACGYHAGDPGVMRNTVKNAKESGVRIGAHPGLPDLLGFGRRKLYASSREITDMVIYQIGALKAFAESEALSLQHVKPHGALYNMAVANEEYARAVAEGVFAVDNKLILFGLTGSSLIKAGKKLGLRVANEVFADRAVNDDGTLVARDLPGAVIKDVEQAIDRVVEMLTIGQVKTIQGNRIKVKADTICVHGDNPSALKFVKSIRKRLGEEGIKLMPVSEFI
ncbi:MAG: LamB/YcsF family protein [Peptococcaceae bacterium BRH_c8a]|nr:MAG: LamB/YcsF family protein [Peptococcaceae bacterium BRH_c8a]